MTTESLPKKKLVFVSKRLDSTVLPHSEEHFSLFAGSQPANGGDKPRTIRRLAAQVVHRHGDRSPITSMRDEAFWEKQLIEKTILRKISSGTELISDGESLIHKANGRGPFGKLTMLGLQQMIDLGAALREELSSNVSNNETRIDEDGNVVYPHIWTPDRPLKPSNLRAVSTKFERTVQSAQAVFSGLFPTGTGDEVIEIDTRHTTLLLPDPQPRQTKEQELLEDKLSNRPHMLQREQELLPLAIRVTRALHPLLAADAREASFGAKQTRTISTESIEIEPLAWNQLGEISKCLSCRGMLPDGLSQRDHEAVVQHAAWRWFETFRHPRLAYLSMRDMCSKMVDDCINYATEPPMTIYSAHDSTLIGLLCAFKLNQPIAWPEYGSFLMMELLEVTDKEKKLYIRFSLNGELLTSCWEEGPSEMIALSTLAYKLRHEDDTTKETTSCL